MAPHSCCQRQKLRRGLWSPDEDEKLRQHIAKHGAGCWSSVPKEAGLQRCGKSCRLRWINYLRPDLRRGAFTLPEENTIIELHNILGNRWSRIASHLPGRTDNEIKNYWNSCIKKKLQKSKASKSSPIKINSDKFPHRAPPCIFAPPSSTNIRRTDNSTSCPLVMDPNKKPYSQSIMPSNITDITYSPAMLSNQSLFNTPGFTVPVNPCHLEHLQRETPQLSQSISNVSDPASHSSNDSIISGHDNSSIPTTIPSLSDEQDVFSTSETEMRIFDDFDNNLATIVSTVFTDSIPPTLSNGFLPKPTVCIEGPKSWSCDQFITVESNMAMNVNFSWDQGSTSFVHKSNGGELYNTWEDKTERSDEDKDDEEGPANAYFMQKLESYSSPDDW